MTSTIDAKVDALLAIDREWAKAASGSDIDKICGYWTDDAVLYNLFGTKLRVEGIEKIRMLITKSRSEAGRSLSWIPVEGFVSESGDVGCTKGTFEVVAPGKDGNPTTRTGTYFNIWKKAVDGMWKCAIETHYE